MDHVNRVLGIVPWLFVAACGAFKAGLRTVATETPVTVQGRATSDCDAFPLDRSFTFDELTGDAAKELGDGRKLCDFQWNVSAAEPVIRAADGCGEPVGSVSIDRLLLEYANDDGAVQRIESNCSAR